MFITQESLNSEEVLFYNELMKRVHWFFFELLVLGAVEDFRSGITFRLHNKAKWELYIEVNAKCMQICTYNLMYYAWVGLSVYISKVSIFGQYQYSDALAHACKQETIIQ